MCDIVGFHGNSFSIIVRTILAEEIALVPIVSLLMYLPKYWCSSWLVTSTIFISNPAFISLRIAVRCASVRSAPKCHNSLFHNLVSKGSDGDGATEIAIMITARNKSPSFLQRFTMKPPQKRRYAE